MHIFVCIKQVPDTETKIKLSTDHNGIDSSQVKWIINPYDEFAIEEALQLKESHGQGKVILISVGPSVRTVDSLRTGLAMGADEAIAINTDQNTDAFSTAKALSLVIQKQGETMMVFTGKLSIDNNGSSVSQMLGEFLNIPHATVISKFKYENNKTTVERDVEKGTREVFEITGPSVISTNKGLNTPRYASLPGIMKAKKKPLQIIEMSDLEMQDNCQKVNFSNFQMPNEKPPVKMLQGEPALQTKKLVQLLREEVKVI